MSRPTIATINLAALRNNLDTLKNISKMSKMVGVVKANAYGNGAVVVATEIEPYVDALAVAFLSEAQELRAAGIVKPILILQGPHSKDDLVTCTLHNIIWMLHSKWQLDAYETFHNDKMADRIKAKAWLKFDSGMHRLGLPLNELPDILQAYASFIDQNTVLATHLADADDRNPIHAEQQISRFLAMAENTQQPLCIANSATSARFSHARQDYVRVGIALYGSTPFMAGDNPLDLQTVMHLNSQIMALRTIQKGETVGYGSTWKAHRDSVIATVALGYADGYPRHAPTGTPAWCNDKIVPLIGRVSMDMLTFDVTDLAKVEVGDSIQLWGDKLPINEVADHIGTIGYELMTRVSSRVPRVYIHATTNKPS